MSCKDQLWKKKPAVINELSGEKDRHFSWLYLLFVYFIYYMLNWDEMKSLYSSCIRCVLVHFSGIKQKSLEVIFFLFTFGSYQILKCANFTCGWDKCKREIKRFSTQETSRKFQIATMWRVFPGCNMYITVWNDKNIATDSS